MSFGSQADWYAVHTKPGAEAAAGRVLESLDLPIFLPRVKHECCSGSTRRYLIRPLFPSYLFARFAPAKHLHKVRYSRGVRRVVGAGESPLPVEERIIEEIAARLTEEGFIHLEPKRWQPGEAVEIKDGPLQGWSGVFERELPDQRRVVILLNTIEQARIVVEKGRLQAVGAN